MMGNLVFWGSDCPFRLGGVRYMYCTWKTFGKMLPTYVVAANDPTGACRVDKFHTRESPQP